MKGDNSLFAQLEKTAVVQQAQNRYLKLMGNQSDSAFEKNIPEDLPEIFTCFPRSFPSQVIRSSRFGQSVTGSRD